MNILTNLFITTYVTDRDAQDVLRTKQGFELFIFCQGDS